MGEVWRTTDTRLGRDVAIKILPEALLANPNRLARFTREAQVLASLSHPSIVTLYDIGSAGGVDYIATELVEAEISPGLDRLGKAAFPFVYCRRSGTGDGDKTAEWIAGT